MTGAEIVLSAQTIKWIQITLGVFVVFILKDAITSVINGVSFMLSSNIRKGDKVIIDGERAIVNHTGFRYTVFSYIREEEDGETGKQKVCKGQKEGERIWRLVANDRLKFVKLEKIIEE